MQTNELKYRQKGYCKDYTLHIQKLEKINSKSRQIKEKCMLFQILMKMTLNVLPYFLAIQNCFDDNFLRRFT